MTYTHNLVSTPMEIAVKNGDDPIARFVCYGKGNKGCNRNHTHADGILCNVKLRGQIIQLMVDIAGYVSIKVCEADKKRFKIVMQGNIGYEGFLLPENEKVIKEEKWLVPTAKKDIYRRKYRIKNK